MARLTDSLLVALLLAACGGDAESRPDVGSGSTAADDEDYDPCALLTSEEIQAAAGWTPDTANAETYGTTKTCAYSGPNAMKQSVVLVIAQPAPKVSSSAEFAERRTKQATTSAPEIKMVITPVEGLGVPAARSEVEGATTATIEAVVGRRLLGVTSADIETVKALVPKAAARLR